MFCSILCKTVFSLIPTEGHGEDSDIVRLSINTLKIYSLGVIRSLRIKKNKSTRTHHTRLARTAFEFLNVPFVIYYIHMYIRAYMCTICICCIIVYKHKITSRTHSTNSTQFFHLIPPHANRLIDALTMANVVWILCWPTMVKIRMRKRPISVDVLRTI